MKNITLKEVLLAGGDMGEMNADKICDQVLNDSFDANEDPISAIIINAFVNNDYSNFDSMVADLNYAINQLKRAISAIENCNPY